MMKSSFDPALIAKAREIILHDPDLNVLSAEREADYSPLVRSMEAEFKKLHATGKLLLPDLSALANQTIGIFSDYSGESIGNYDTYSFLICGWGSLHPFWQQMQQVRKRFAMGSKEIAFKDFGMGVIQRALPSYLETLNGYVPGLLFTLVVDKRTVSLFGSRDRSTAAGGRQNFGRERFWHKESHP